MKRVLITGATGFLGGYVVDEFYRSGYHIIATGRNAEKLQKLKKQRVAIWQGDLSDLSRLTKRVDVVVHVAARSTVWGAWQHFYNDNVIGTQHVINFCHQNKVQRLVFISSPSVYSGRGDKLHIKEDNFDGNNQLNNYIRSKIEAERCVMQAHEDGLETVILRPRGLIGIGDTSIVPRLLGANDMFGIPLFHDGNNLVDLTCVENVALATRLAAETPKAVGNVYNITNDEPKELKTILDKLFTNIQVIPRYKRRNITLFYVLAAIIEVVYTLLRIAKEPPLTRYTVCTLGYSQTLDITKAKQDLGYKPIVSLTEGIKRYAAAHKRASQ